MTDASAAPHDLNAVRIDGLRRTVSDLGRSIDFYCGALGFALTSDGLPASAQTTRLQLGEQHIDLTVPAHAAPLPAVANAPSPRFQHAAIVTHDMDAAWRRLGPYAPLMISRGGPQRLPANTGGVTAVKFRDPDGHPLELIQFPVGVGEPRWRVAQAAGPTLGIDHFALVVTAIDASTAFFAAQLGLRVASRGVNRGLEQDRLDGLDGVEVDVVALEPRRGPRVPHLELLGYRRPQWAGPAGGLGLAAEWSGTADAVVCCGNRPQAADLGRGPMRLRDPDGHHFIVQG